MTVIVNILFNVHLFWSWSIFNMCCFLFEYEVFLFMHLKNFFSTGVIKTYVLDYDFCTIDFHHWFIRKQEFSSPAKQCNVVSQQTFLVFQDVFKTYSLQHFSSSKTSWRRLQDVFAIRLPKASSRLLQGVFKTSCKTSSRRFKTSLRRLQDMFARRFSIMSSRRIVRQNNVTLKTSSVLLHQDKCLLGWIIPFLRSLKQTMTEFFKSLFSLLSLFSR